MADIVALLSCLSGLLPKTTRRQMSHVLFGMICLSGKVTMLSVSRWTTGGGSYRSIERCYEAEISWSTVHWQFFCTHVKVAKRHYLLAGDEVVVGKAGKSTYGVGRHYSSIAGQVIPSVAFFSLSLIDTLQRSSHPIAIEQCLNVAKALVAPALSSEPIKRGRGRPKGSTNKPKTAVLNPELQHILTMTQQVLALVQQEIDLTYWVLDGHFGNAPSVQMVRQCGLHLVSKLRHDAALYLPYSGPYAGRGPLQRYGDKLNYTALPNDALRQSTIEDEIRTDIYQMQVLHKEFTDPLNVVVICKTKLKTGKRGQVILFSTDLTLAFDLIIDYYSLRFQIEFNFRDAKQFWGLDSFMNVKAQTVTNAVNIAFLMVNLSALLIQPFRIHQPAFSIIDLKAHYRAQRYLTETLNLLPEKPATNLFKVIFQRLSALGSIHPTIPVRKAA